MPRVLRQLTAELLAKRYNLLTDKVQLEGVKQVVFEGDEDVSD